MTWAITDLDTTESRRDTGEGLLPGLDWAIKQILAAAPRSPHTVATHRIYREMAAFLETHAQAIREHARAISENSL
ncbi:hypothetical protein [Paraburkholderia sediminicola]|uniref:hypothetical protein n=1 Tax=Paraburkholderia sediminicola TaxID=458836 RepID=UPI0038BD4E2B